MHQDTDRDGCPIRAAMVIALIIAALVVGWIAERGMRPSALTNRAAHSITTTVTHAAQAIVGTPANATTQQVRK